MELTLQELKKQSDNKIILHIDHFYKITLNTVINGEIKTYQGIPMVAEDFYYEFLYEAPRIVRIYDETSNVPFKTFLGLKCKYFVLNRLRHFTSNKYKVMNNYQPIVDGEQKVLRDSIGIPLEIDTSELSDLEFMIYRDYYLDQRKLKWIIQNRKLSRHKVNTLITAVKIKLISQVKN